MPSTRPEAREQITGLILCGGRGQRVGGADKPLLDFHGQPLVARVAVIDPVIAGKLAGKK